MSEISERVQPDYYEIKECAWWLDRFDKHGIDLEHLLVIKAVLRDRLRADESALALSDLGEAPVQKHVDGLISSETFAQAFKDASQQCNVRDMVWAAFGAANIAVVDGEHPPVNAALNAKLVAEAREFLWVYHDNDDVIFLIDRMAAALSMEPLAVQQTTREYCTELSAAKAIIKTVREYAMEMVNRSRQAHKPYYLRIAAQLFADLGDKVLADALISPGISIEVKEELCGFDELAVARGSRCAKRLFIVNVSDHGDPQDYQFSCEGLPVPCLIHRCQRDHCVCDEGKPQASSGGSPLR